MHIAGVEGGSFSVLLPGINPFRLWINVHFSCFERGMKAAAQECISVVAL